MISNLRRALFSNPLQGAALGAKKESACLGIVQAADSQQADNSPTCRLGRDDAAGSAGVNWRAAADLSGPRRPCSSAGVTDFRAVHTRAATHRPMSVDEGVTAFPR